MTKLAASFRHNLCNVQHYLRLGLRTAFFRLPSRPIPDITPLQLLVLIVFAELVTILFGRLDIRGSATFYPHALLWGWFYVVVSLWLCWYLVWKSSGETLGIRPINLFAIVVSQGLVIDIATNLAYLPILHGDNRVGSWLHWALYGVTLAWAILAFLNLVLKETRPGRKAVAVAVALTVGMPFLAYHIQEPQYWYADTTEPSTRKAYLELTQEGIEKQLQIAAQQRNSLVPGQQGKVELYTISFAPYANENVFLNESTMINKLMHEQFATSGHSQELINHVDTNLDKPWATLENLERAIHQAGARMNKDEDLLFIYLTSHGSRDFRLSASHWPLKLQELSPQTLSLWLDKAGIKNRVIAVSACYSGGWIDVLKNDYTLVMTAADKDHTSYGCGHKSDLTYFGNAVFNEALRQTFSFEKAFHTAVPVIKKREEEAGKEDGFSNPQIYVGNGIKPLLDDMEQRLQALKIASD